MHLAAKKLHLIAEILKIEDEAVLDAVEAVISKSKLAIKAIDEADQIWDQKNYSSDTMNQWLNEERPSKQ